MTRRALTAGVLCAAITLPFGLGLSGAGVAPLSTVTSQSDELCLTVTGIVSEDSGLSVSINSLPSRIITDENELVITGTVRNDSSTTLANISLKVFVANETPISVSVLTTAFSDDESDATHAASPPLTDVARGATTLLEIRTPMSSLPLIDTEEWDPRVATVIVTSGEYPGKDQLIIVWGSGAQISTLRVSTVIPWASAGTTQDRGERSAILSLTSISSVTLTADPLLIPRGPQPTTTLAPSASPSTSPSADAGQSKSNSAQSGQFDAESGQSDAPTASSSASPTSTPAPTATDPMQRMHDLQSETFVVTLLSNATEIIALPEKDTDLGALSLSGNTGFWDHAPRSMADFPDTLRRAGWVVPANSPVSPSPSASVTPLPSGILEATLTPSVSMSITGQSATTTFSSDSGPLILRNIVWPTNMAFDTSFLSGFSSLDQITITPVGALTPAEDVPLTSCARVSVNPTTGEISTDRTGVRSFAQQSDTAALPSWNVSGGDEFDAEQALTVITAIITREHSASSRIIFVATQRRTVINERLTSRAKVLFSPRQVSAMSFSEMAASEPIDTDRQTAGAGVLAIDAETAISTMASSLTVFIPFVNAIDDTDAVYASVTPQTLPTLSAQLTPSEQLGVATAITSQVTTILSAVTVEPSSVINPINKSINFLVLVCNNLPWLVRADVTLVPDDPRLHTIPVQSQTLATRGTTTVEVSVRTIDSGDIEVTYKVITLSGVVLDDSQIVTVRTRTGWEDTITVIIASLFGLLFLAGIMCPLHGGAARKTQATSDDADTADITTETETATTKEIP